MLFTYELDGIGWAQVEMEADGHHYSAYLSYLTDPLNDLVEAMDDFLFTKYVNRAQFPRHYIMECNQEPTIDKWELHMDREDEIEIRIIRHYDTDDMVEVFNQVLNIREFLRVLLVSMERLLQKHGILGYFETWRGLEFPLSRYLKLKHYLLGDGKEFCPWIGDAPDTSATRDSDFAGELTLLQSLGNS